MSAPHTLFLSLSLSLPVNSNSLSQPSFRMNHRRWPLRTEIFHLRGISLLDDPRDVLRAASVSRRWRGLVIQHRICRKLFAKRFPRVTRLAYEVRGRYNVIRVSDALSEDVDEWKSLELEHRICSFLLQPRAKLLDCPRDCLVFPLGSSTVAEKFLTELPPHQNLVDYPFSTDEGKYSKPASRLDFVQHLDSDVCISIMSFIDDPADFVRAGAVSRVWRHFVIANGLAKQLCLKEHPQLSSVAGVAIGSPGASTSAEAGTSTSVRSEFLQRDHTVYASLLHSIKRSMVLRKDCIQYALSASSTDRFPNESVRNTVHPGRGSNSGAAFWSSKGHNSPRGSETLVYKLRPGLWQITEVDIQPFQAIWQNLKPIYPARSVRFRIGHPVSADEISTDPESFPLPDGVDDKFVWTYTSPEYPMAQVNVLQPFKLPKPILCFDGYMQVELQDMVQRQEYNGLFYMRMDYVRVVGRPLSPAFDMAIDEASGAMRLTYYPMLLGDVMNDPGEQMWLNRLLLLEGIVPFRQPQTLDVLFHQVMHGGRFYDGH